MLRDTIRRRLSQRHPIGVFAALSVSSLVSWFALGLTDSAHRRQPLLIGSDRVV